MPAKSKEKPTNESKMWKTIDGLKRVVDEMQVNVAGIATETIHLGEEIEKINSVVKKVKDRMGI